MRLNAQPKSGCFYAGAFRESTLFSFFSSQCDPDSHDDLSNTPRNLFAKKVHTLP